MATISTPQWKDFSVFNTLLNYVHIKKVKDLSLVCKNWNEFTLSHRFKSIKTFHPLVEPALNLVDRQPISESEMNENLQHILKYSYLVKSLNINRELVSNNYNLLINNFSNLIELKLVTVKISPIMLAIIASESQQLERITLQGCEIVEDDLNELNEFYGVNFSENLKHFSTIRTQSDLYPGCDWDHDYINHSNIQSFKFCSSNITFLTPFLNNYPELKQFEFNDYGDTSARNTATQALEYNPQITHLTYIDNHLTAKICDLMFNHFPNLEYLKVGAKKVNTKYTIQDEAIKNLRVLDLGEYEEKSAHLALTLLPHCSNLTKLKIFVRPNTCELVKIIADKCPNLTELFITSDLIKFGSRQNFFPWTSHLGDEDILEQEFACANNLQRLTLQNVVFTGLSHDGVNQFKKLKTAQFEFQMRWGIDMTTHELKDRLDSFFDFTSYFDHNTGTVKGFIHIRNTIE